MKHDFTLCSGDDRQLEPGGGLELTGGSRWGPPSAQRVLCVSTLCTPASRKGGTPGPGPPHGRHMCTQRTRTALRVSAARFTAKVCAHAHPSAPLTLSSGLPGGLARCRDTLVCVETAEKQRAEGGHTWSRILEGGERRRNPRGRPPRRGGVAKTEHGLCHFMGRPDPGTRTGWDTHVVGGRASTFGGCSRPGCEDTGDTHGPVLRGRAPGRCPHPVSSQLTSARLSCCCGCPQPKTTPEFPPIPSPGSRSSRGPGLGCTFPGGLGHFLLPCRHHSLMWVWSGQGPPARQCLGRAPASAIRNQRVPCWPWGQSCRN